MTLAERLRFWRSQPVGDDSWHGEWGALLALHDEAADRIEAAERLADTVEDVMNDSTERLIAVALGLALAAYRNKDSAQQEGDE